MPIVLPLLHCQWLKVLLYASDTIRVCCLSKSDDFLPQNNISFDYFLLCLVSPRNSWKDHVTWIHWRTPYNKEPILTIWQFCVLVVAKCIGRPGSREYLPSWNISYGETYEPRSYIKATMFCFGFFFLKLGLSYIKVIQYTGISINPTFKPKKPRGKCNFFTC